MKGAGEFRSVALAAALHLSEAGENQARPSGRESVDRLSLRREPESRLALPGGGDPLIGDEPGRLGCHGRSVQTCVTFVAQVCTIHSAHPRSVMCRPFRVSRTGETITGRLMATWKKRSATAPAAPVAREADAQATIFQ